MKSPQIMIRSLKASDRQSHSQDLQVIRLRRGVAAKYLKLRIKEKLT